VGEYATNIWDEVPDWGGLGARKLVRSPSNALGASIWEFQPGSTQFVYHFHHGGEELLIVLRGPEGGHQIRNDADAAARVLIIGSHVNPDVAEYDTGKVATIIDGDHRFHRVSDEVEHAGPE
jgi:uncharacterized cupin superfamily protein